MILALALFLPITCAQLQHEKVSLSTLSLLSNQQLADRSDMLKDCPTPQVKGGSMDQLDSSIGEIVRHLQLAVVIQNRLLKFIEAKGLLREWLEQAEEK